MFIQNSPHGAAGSGNVMKQFITKQGASLEVLNVAGNNLTGYSSVMKSIIVSITFLSDLLKRLHTACSFHV